MIVFYNSYLNKQQKLNLNTSFFTKSVIAMQKVMRRVSPIFIIVICLFALNSADVLARSYKYERYDRLKHFGKWLDLDNDCLNTRHEVLAQESLISPIIKNCKVVYGKWFDFYSGQFFYKPWELEIDHFIPLFEAYVSGARNWSQEQRIKYMNDLDNPDTLIAVSRTENQDKLANEPSRWLPSNKNYHCEYLKKWLELKKYWNLSFDDKEKKFLLKKMRDCDY